MTKWLIEPNPMKDELSKQQSDTIVKALDKAIEQGPWEASTFLRVVGKKLRELREEFVAQLDMPTTQKAKESSLFASKMALRSGQQEIFIALYSSDGTNIQSWERILANLPKHMLSRPIYAKEDDVISLLKTKENKDNEAYVSIYINQGDILLLPADRTPVDKLGKPMLTLKDKSLNTENINRFVHKSVTYTYSHGRCIKTS